MNNSTKKIVIRFCGRTSDSNKVPVSILNQVLSGIQRSIQLLAMQHHQIEVREKDRISNELEDKYVLMCEAPQPGSLQIQASLGDPMSDLFAPSDIIDVATNFESFCKAIQENDISSVRRIMPDRNRRKRLIDALGKTVPKSGSGIQVRVGWGGEPFLLSQKVQPALRGFATESATIEEVQTVTGRLVRIDFDEHKVTIHFTPTGRELECFYEESVEEMLLERPRELIQVTGVIRLDENGLPKKIVDVEKIRELDLSRFYRESIRDDTFFLKFDPPLVLEPQLVENDQLLLLKNDSLGIDVIAPTVEELSENLHDEIIMLWNNYAKADTSELSPRAQELKKNLLSRIKEEKYNG